LETAIYHSDPGGAGDGEADGISAGLGSTGSARRVVRLYELVFPGVARVALDRATRAMHLGFWDGATRSHREAVENEDRTLAWLAGIEAGTRVLDAGCGYGSSALWLARETGAEVVGVDLAPNHVAHARRLAVRAGVADRVRFHRRDFRNTGFAGGTFDVVWAVESLCHAEDGDAFLAEAHRLLKPGGRLVVADLFRSARPLQEEEELLLQSWLAGWAVPDLLTAGELLEAAREAGFSGVLLEDATAEVWPSSRRLYRRALLGLPAARTLRQAGALSGERLAAIRSGLLQFEALGNGLWSYGVLTASKPGDEVPAVGEIAWGGVRC
jgi:cyclopropane fatty-acyl-phospholipid synthase-like methyltransferase